MFTYLLDIVCVVLTFPVMSFHWTVGWEPIHVYFHQLWDFHIQLCVLRKMEDEREDKTLRVSKD